MDHGSGDLTAPDSAVDRDDFGRVGVGWGLIPCLVGTMPVEVVFIGGENLAGVGFVEQQDVVGAFGSGSTDPAFRPAIRSRLTWWRLHDIDALGGEHRVKGLGEVRAAVADELTPVFGWSMYSMRKAWNQAKDTVAPWWAECSKEAYATGLDQLARGLKNWSDSKKGKRAGRPVGFPRFKAKRRTTPSVRFTTGTIRLEDDRKHVTLPVLGTIKTHESTRKLHRKITAGVARVLSATVRFETGRWFESSPRRSSVYA